MPDRTDAGQCLHGALDEQPVGQPLLPQVRRVRRRRGQTRMTGASSAQNPLYTASAAISARRQELWTCQ
jgi:hypothetical protein